MSKDDKAKWQAARVALDVWRAERSMSTRALAESLGMKRPDLCAALRNPDANFCTFSRLLRVQRETGLALWIDAAEVAELKVIGEKLSLNLFIADILTIRDQARRAGLSGPPFAHVVPAGFPMFGALLAHFFPASSTLAHPRYKVRKPSPAAE